MEPRAEDRGHWITHPRLAYSVAATQLALVSFAWVVVRRLTARGLLCVAANAGWCVAQDFGVQLHGFW
jgi:hypothetical protein